MNFKRVVTALLFAPIIVAITETIILACFSSPRPPTCPRTIYFAKTTPGSILVPGDGSDFNAPIGGVAFVSWDPQSACAQPTAASVSLHLSCQAPGGNPFDLGTQVFQLPTPSVSGAQSIPGGFFQYAIPGGTPSSVCDVTGTFSTTFNGGIGAGTISGAGDVEVCLIEPAPGDPSGDTPRLDLELLTPEPLPGSEGGNGTYTFHAGDQEYIYIRIENNDLENSANVKVNSEGRQTAGFPDGINTEDDAYNSNLFRISNSDADVFPSMFFDADGPLPFDRIPGDPQSSDPGGIENNFILEPGEVEVFGIAINSFGACADGSCNERNVCAEATFSNSDVIKACAQFAYFVDNDTTPRYPGLTVMEETKVHPQVDAQWTGVEFRDDQNQVIDFTHGTNLRQDQRVIPQSGIQTTGDSLQGPFQSPWASSSQDQVTLPRQATSAHWTSFNFDQRRAFQRVDNNVNVIGLDQLQGDCPIPLITPVGFQPDVLNLNFFPEGSCDDNMPVEVGVGPAPVFTTTLGQLKADQNFNVDDASCRTIRFPHGNNLDAPFLVTDPAVIVHNFDSPDPLTELIRLLDQIGSDAGVNVEVIGGPGVSVPSPTAFGTLDVTIDPTALTPGRTDLWWLVLSNDNFINSPLRVPIVGRINLPQVLAVDHNFNGPDLIQTGQEAEFEINIPDLLPPPPNPFINMEFFIGIPSVDDVIFKLPEGSTFTLSTIDSTTSEAEKQRLKSKFGEDPINRCSEGVWKCGKIEFGDGFTFETEIFADGFESGDVSAWSTGAAADNSENSKKDKPVGVLNEDKKLPVFTEEELRQAIELFNDDVVFDEKTIGLVTDRFGIEVPLPPIRGTYFFDEFESFRKRTGEPVVTVDGSNCPTPCSGLVLQGGNGGINGISFENFPDFGVVLESDSNVVTNSGFSGNGMGGLLIQGNNNTIGSTEENSNSIINNGGAGIVGESGSGNNIMFNSFDDNAGLAIDLGNDGITNNDVGDTDNGPNNLQNYPVLTNVQLQTEGRGPLVEGDLNSVANATFTLQFYMSTSCDPSGNGEGEMILDSTVVTTDGNGDASFSFTASKDSEKGHFITSTATDASGNTSEFSACFEIKTIVTVEDEITQPKEFELFANYPNPFNPSTTIDYTIPIESEVRLTIYNINAQPIRTLVNGKQAIGHYSVDWDGRDRNGTQMSSGMYLYKIEASTFVETRKMMLMK